MKKIKNKFTDVMYLAYADATNSIYEMKRNAAMTLANPSRKTKSIGALMAMLFAVFITMSMSFAVNNGEDIKQNIIGMLGTIFNIGASIIIGVAGVVIICGLIWAMTTTNPQSTARATGLIKKALICLVLFGGLKIIITFAVGVFDDKTDQLDTIMNG